MHADADWLPVSEEEKEALDYIEAYIKGTEKDEMRTTMFLESICKLCKMREEKALSESPSIFCHRKGLAEEIKEMVENKPIEQMCTAMLAITALSELKAVREDKIIPLLNACFKSVFYLPPKEDLNIELYDHVLLPFTTSESKIVRERAIERIWKLCGFLASSFCPKFDMSSLPFSFLPQPLKEFLQPDQRTVVVLMTLEKTTGNCSTEDQDYARIILEMVLQDPVTWLMDVSRLRLDCHALPSTALEHPKPFKGSEEQWDWEKYQWQQGKWLQHSCSNILPVSSQQVPEILGSIHRNLKKNQGSLQQTVLRLLDKLICHFPRDVTLSVLVHLPESDSTTLEIWKGMLSSPQSSGRVLEELFFVLKEENFTRIPTEISLLRQTVMPPTEENLKELCKPAVLQTLLKTKSLPILWLVLRGLDLLSQRPETGGQCSLDEKEIVCFGQAKEIRALVPNMFTVLSDDANIALKLLTVFRNTLNQLGKREASSFALELSENLLPLFNHVSSEVRECSIHLFKDLMEAVVLWHWGNMKENVRRGLLPLLFRWSDETPSVAQASREALVACAKFLKWKKLKHRAREENKEGIMKCLMQQGRKTAERYLWQSLPYLRDSQSSVRCEAIEFIGLAVQQCRDQSEEKLNEIYSGE
ncbi:hypothetical protein ASZ78_010389 [Callipepla squamata]|uniref:Uncharacterized protein n=1 Tax=Callipepla squamata TaxID=9009 RepID=A0A226NAY5_CALSU|nr:hypothetical protein ASZ78_010389 [Callipepla squamata]